MCQTHPGAWPRSRGWLRRGGGSWRRRPRAAESPRSRSRCRSQAGANCIRIGLPGKLILGDYFQENRSSGRPFLLLRISFPGRPIFIQFIPGEEGRGDYRSIWCRRCKERQIGVGFVGFVTVVLLGPFSFSLPCTLIHFTHRRMILIIEELR